LRRDSGKARLFKTLQTECEPLRRRAFPINELRINCLLQSWICIGVTQWLLTDPGRLWPWFTLGWASLASLLVATLLEPDPGAIAGSLLFAALAAVPLAWAGWSVQALGYTGLGWIALGAAGLLAAIVVVRCILSAWPRSSNP